MGSDVYASLCTAFASTLINTERTHVDVRLEDMRRGRHERTVTSAPSFSDDTQTAVRAVFVKCHLVLYVFL